MKAVENQRLTLRGRKVSQSDGADSWMKIKILERENTFSKHGLKNSITWLIILIKMDLLEIEKNSRVI